MKLLFALSVILCLASSYGQAQAQNYTDTRLFAQCMFDVSDQSEMEELQNGMYNNPNIEMVRLDYNTQRALIITANLEVLSSEDFISWFGEYGAMIYCIQIGVYGIDIMHTYPFTNCQ